MAQKKNKVFVIAPHMDDEVLGCGGVILRHKEKGDIVYCVFVAHRIYNHKFDDRRNKIEKRHALMAKAVLDYDEAIFLDLSDERLDGCVQDIIIPLEKYAKVIRPEIVYLPFKGDNNQDHRAVYEASRVVFRPAATPFINTISLYEVPSSTEQSPPLPENAFLPNYYADISNHLNQKMNAYRCYKTEKRNYPHPRSEEALKILAKKRGAEINFRYAEAFMMIRNKW